MTCPVSVTTYSPPFEWFSYFFPAQTIDDHFLGINPRRVIYRADAGGDDSAGSFAFLTIHPLKLDTLGNCVFIHRLILAQIDSQ
jgi:hypothetical protein